MVVVVVLVVAVLYYCLGIHAGIIHACMYMCHYMCECARTYAYTLRSYAGNGRGVVPTGSDSSSEILTGIRDLYRWDKNGSVAGMRALGGGSFAYVIYSYCPCISLHIYLLCLYLDLDR